MRGKLRQWFVDNPKAMTAAYFLLMGGSVFMDISLQQISGATNGP